MDNIVKPILDSLVGKNGLLVDDVIVDRITVNWIDTPHKDYIEVNIEYPELYYLKKSELSFIKSMSGWCFPTTLDIYQQGRNIIQRYFELWDSIETEKNYYKVLPLLPIQKLFILAKLKIEGIHS